MEGEEEKEIKFDYPPVPLQQNGEYWDILVFALAVLVVVIVMYEVNSSAMLTELSALPDRLETLPEIFFSVNGGNPNNSDNNTAKLQLSNTESAGGE